jgi:hypothetical protein
MHRVASSKNSQRGCAKVARLNEPDERDIGIAGRLPKAPSDRMIDESIMVLLFMKDND